MGCQKLTYYDSTERALEKKLFFEKGALEKRYAEEKNRIDYYPFGMLMPGRSFSTNLYRFGFNGMEKDEEVSGEGNSYTAEYWQYDSRLGRRWNVDPVVKVHESPYATFANNPIWFIDPSGADTSFADNQARNDFNKAHNEVLDMIANVDNEMVDLRKKAKEKGKSEKWLNKRLNKLQDTKNQYEKLKSDFDDVISNVATFHYTSDTKALDVYDDGAVLGGPISRGEDGKLTSKTVINIAIRAGEISVYIHENRHLNQIMDNSNLSILESEVDAFNYQVIFNSQSIKDYRQKVHDYYFGADMGAKMPLISLEKAIKIVYNIK